MYNSSLNKEEKLLQSFKDGIPRDLPFRLGLAHVVFGCLTVGLAIVTITNDATNYKLQVALWSGLVFLSTGIIGILAGRHRYGMVLIISFVVLTFVCIIATLCLFITSCSAVIIDRNRKEESFLELKDIATAANAILCVVGLAEIVICIMALSLSCNQISDLLGNRHYRTVLYCSPMPPQPGTGSPLQTSPGFPPNNYTFPFPLFNQGVTPVIMPSSHLYSQNYQGIPDGSVLNSPNPIYQSPIPNSPRPTYISSPNIHKPQQPERRINLQESSNESNTSMKERSPRKNPVGRNRMTTRFK